MTSTKEQIQFAKWLLDEDDNINSPLHDKIYFNNINYYVFLSKISNGESGDLNRRQKSELNWFIKELDKKYNGYIKQNYEQPE